MCAVVVAASLMLALTCAYFWFQGNFAASMPVGLGAVVAVIVGRRLARRDQRIAFHASAAGAVVGLVVVGYVIPYRATAARLSLTPETLPAEVVFEVLYMTGAAAGAYLGSYLPVFRSRGYLTIDDR